MCSSNLNQKQHSILTSLGEKMQKESMWSLILMMSVLMSEAMADSSSSSVQIVYTEKPLHQEPEAFHLRILASVLGSEVAAKEALIYSYKTVACGFSARLTPDQVLQISKLPGVLEVVPSRTLHLQSVPKMRQMKM